MTTTILEDEGLIDAPKCKDDPQCFNLSLIS